MNKLHRIGILTLVIAAAVTAVAAAAGGHPGRGGTPSAATAGGGKASYRESSGKVIDRGGKRRPAPRQPHLGRYVGPPHNGTSSCGYVAVGPGMEQASSFALRGSACGIARRVALASRNHVNIHGTLRFRAAGFDCTGSVAKSLLHYDCRNGSQRIAFDIR